MVVLTEKFRFIRDDVFLCPWVDSKTGKQKLVMQKIDLETNEVEFEDFIDCIHTAVIDIHPKTFEDYHNDAHIKENFYNQTLEIRSSEKLNEINLTPDEKYIALKSWVGGIAEAGKDALSIQSTIDRTIGIWVQISSRLLSFMAKIDPDFIYEILRKVEKECRFEGEYHKSSMIANLLPVLWNIKNKSKLEPEDQNILSAILSMNPPPELFVKNPNLIYLLRYNIEKDKNYFLNTIHKIKKSEEDIIAFTSPILKCFFDEYRQQLLLKKNTNQFLKIADYIENLGLSNKIIQQIYFKVYGIKENELKSVASITKDISNIRGLKYLKNLRSLLLRGNNKEIEYKIQEIKGIDHLTKLRELYLYDNKIEKIQEIEKLKNLRTLHLASNKITKIEGLEKLKNLRKLWLDGNKITKIEGLDRLTNLEELRLSRNKITKIEGLDRLTNLKDLYLGGNKITKIEGLDRLTNLKFLHLGGNKITEIEGLDYLPPNLKDYLPSNLNQFVLEGYSFRSQIVNWAKGFD